MSPSHLPAHPAPSLLRIQHDKESPRKLAFHAEYTRTHISQSSGITVFYLQILSDWDLPTRDLCKNFLQSAAKASCVRLLTALARERLIPHPNVPIPDGVGAGELLMLLKGEITRHMDNAKVDNEKFASAFSELSNSTKNEAICVVYRRHWATAFQQYVKDRSD